MPDKDSHCADAGQGQNAPIQSLEAWGPPQLPCLLHNVWKSAYTPYHQITVDPNFPLMALSFTQVNLLKAALDVVVVVLVVLVGFVP